jgi:hypothetical protein
MLELDFRKPQLADDAGPFYVDCPHQTWFHLDRTTQERDQKSGAHQLVGTPAFPARRVIFRIARSKLHKAPGRESVKHPQFGIG